MKFWRIRIYKPASEKGQADTLVVSMNYQELEDMLSLICDFRDKIIEQSLKISISLFEVSI